MNEKTLLTLYVTPESSLRCTTNLLAALTGLPPRPTNLEIVYVNGATVNEEDGCAVPYLKIERNGQRSFVAGDLADGEQVQHALKC